MIQSFSRSPPLPGTPITLIVPLKFVLFAVDTFPFNASGSNVGHPDTMRGREEAVHLRDSLSLGNTKALVLPSPHHRGA